MSQISVVPAGEERATRTPAPEPGSVLARLRQAAQAQREVRTLELPVGGAFGDQLRVRYGVLPLEEMDRYADLTTGRVRLSTLTIEMMVAACHTVVWHDAGTSEDLHVRLDGHLWELLGWPLPEGVDQLTPKEIVLGLFNGNGLAIVAHVERLIGWMRGEEPDAGESSAATS